MGTQSLLLRVGASQLKLLPLLKNPWKGRSSWRAAWIPSPPRANWCVWSRWRRQRRAKPRSSTCANLPQHPWTQTCPSWITDVREALYIVMKMNYLFRILFGMRVFCKSPFYVTRYVESEVPFVSYPSSCLAMELDRPPGTAGTAGPGCCCTDVNTWCCTHCSCCR